ncbi:MAG: diacylglycerol kinase, partial [Bifidobacterium longum]
MQEMFTYGAPWPQTTSPPITIGAMPQPALTVFLIIAAIAIVVVLIAVIVIALRAQRRRKLAQTLEKRRDDEVQYAFIVNPSKPQAEAR